MSFTDIKFDKSKKLEKETHLRATSGSGTGSDEDCEPETPQTKKDCKTSGWACWAPVLVFIILFIIVMIGVFCSGCDYKGYAGKGWTGCGIAGVVLLFFVIWLLLLCFFCKSGDTRAAWFFMLLLIAIVFVWVIACFLGKLTAC